ncbi:hypothetical protein CC78DRAFT_6162 [Lojkania enalia]|uniref:Uncharacterized protein n=1 Tax=Lojkania enalia TaxID=147567 RepID=A0A9P4TRF8_9PLEO|nr:hypothetical protein CC78DRAFT_6162 [Didymosphaeria enalia]
MTNPPTSATMLKSKATEYEEIVDRQSTNNTRFRVLKAFLSSASSSKAKIHLVRFREKDTPNPINIPEDDLEKHIQKNNDHGIYIVENLSPSVLCLFGGYCNVDPEFFIDYLDMVLPSASTPKRSKEESLVTEPLPWYRMGDIENHLPPLRSTQQTMEHIHFRFIGPREYHPSKLELRLVPIKIGERLEIAASTTNIRRIAGGYHSIHVEDQRLWPIAMTRHSAAAWFDRGNQWTKGIILLDPPFRYSQSNFVRQHSKYRSFRSRSHSEAPPSFDADTRDSYTTSLLHYLQLNPNVRIRVPTPIAILQDLYRMIASEWLAVNAYVARDLNAIEWRLERDKPSVSALDFFLDQLFIMRRRTKKYETLINDHLRPFLPSSWIDRAAEHIIKDIEADFLQVQEQIRSSNERITQTVSLITSLISVVEGKKATTLNQRLAFLTILATIALPFNVFAAIFGMQTEYGPGASRFWVFGEVAGGTAGVVLVCYLGFLVVPGVRERRVRKGMM